MIEQYCLMFSIMRLTETDRQTDSRSQADRMATAFSHFA